MADTSYIERRCKIEPMNPGRDILVALLAEVNFESFVDTEEGMSAYIPSGDFDQEAVDAILHNPPEDFRWEAQLIEIPVQNYNAQWESNFQQVEVENGLLIRAPFHPENPDFPIQIVVSPKMAFGTGHHETTWLIARDMLKHDYSGQRVLDMGCGTGVLAILAEKLGSNSVVAIDIDPWSTENTEENIGLNDSRYVEVRLGDAKAIGEDLFDSILANINRNILTNDMAVYAKAMKPGARIWFSGFFKPDAEVVQQSAESEGLKVEFMDSKGDWAMIRAIKPA